MTGTSAMLAFLIAAGVALLATPAVRRLAIMTGFLAMPSARGVHDRPVPQLGGLAIFLGFAAVLVWRFGIADPTTRSVLTGGAAILVLGVIDDRIRLRPGVKLLGQIAVAALTVAMGVRVEWISNPLGPGLLALDGWSYPLTMLWIIAVVNVMNLIDGLDGLAAGVASIAAITLMVTALHTGLPEVSIVLSAALAGSALGFLPYNFNPARIFMGDAGAMFLGFGLAVVSVEGLLKSTTVVALGIPILAMGLPIADTFLAIVRRIHSGRPIAEADRQHLHHRLLDMGLSHRDAVIFLYIISGWLGLSAWALTTVETVGAIVIFTFVVASMYFFARRFGLLRREQERNLKS
ncbi:MAG TPA: MraY family glycosyltransferase [Bacillota bacterium]